MSKYVVIDSARQNIWAEFPTEAEAIEYAQWLAAATRSEYIVRPSAAAEAAPCA